MNQSNTDLQEGILLSHYTSYDGALNILKTQTIYGGDGLRNYANFGLNEYPNACLYAQCQDIHLIFRWIGKAEDKDYNDVISNKKDYEVAPDICYNLYLNGPRRYAQSIIFPYSQNSNDDLLKFVGFKEIATKKDTKLFKEVKEIALENKDCFVRVIKLEA